MIQPAIVCHGGAGAPAEWKDGCEKAARIGLALLNQKSPALKAAVASTVSLEDDGRFNAGRGSAIRFDGKTIEMDAALMDSQGNLGAVAIIRGVKNPILVAEKVTQTPHHLIAGEGAVHFARKLGFPEFYEPSPPAKKRYNEFISKNPDQFSNARDQWNFPEPFPTHLSPVDTVGTVVRDTHGNFAAAVSTGGSGMMLMGRIGDTPLIGSGFYVGSEGAVAVTGIGEEIMKKVLAKTVYDWIAQGLPAEAACRQGVDLFDSKTSVGIIAISKKDTAALSNREMPYAIL